MSDQNPNEESPAPKQRRGFALMDREKLAAIAIKGGKASHASGKAHRWSRDEAIEAGRKGGIAVHARRREQAAK